MSPVKRINHVAIVVDDIEHALSFWRDALGLSVAHVEEVPDQHSVVAFLPTGEAEVELVKPTSEDSGISKYLSKRGPGMHHICFEVDDLNVYLERMRSLGIRLINEQPILGTGGKRIAFIHPSSTQGVLVELYELTEQEPAIRAQRYRRLASRALEQSQALAAAVVAFLRAFRERDKSEEDIAAAGG